MDFGEDQVVDHEAEAAEQAEIASQVEEQPVETTPVDPDPANAAADAETPQVEDESAVHSAPVAPSVEDEEGNAEPVSGALIESADEAAPVTSPLDPGEPEPTVTVKRVDDTPVNIAVAGFQIYLTEATEQDEVPKSVADLIDPDVDYVEVVA